MREPKFRIPMKCTACGKHGFFEDKWNIPQKKFIRVEFGWCCSATACRVIGEPQQRTGLQDTKTKAGIYKDDIVNLSDGGEYFDYDKGNNFRIDWWPDMACWWIFIADGLPFECDINIWSYGPTIMLLGSRHKNPELLVGE